MHNWLGIFQIKIDWKTFSLNYCLFHKCHCIAMHLLDDTKLCRAFTTLLNAYLQLQWAIKSFGQNMLLSFDLFNFSFCSLLSLQLEKKVLPLLCGVVLKSTMTYLNTSSHAACLAKVPCCLPGRDACIRHGSSSMQALGPNSRSIAFCASSAS